MDTMLRYEPVRIDPSDVIIEKLNVGDSNVLSVLAMAKKSYFLVYSIEFIYTSCDTPGNIPNSEKNIGHLVCNHFGYME